MKTTTKDEKLGNKAYEVTYDKANGKIGTIIVKTNALESILSLAAQSCFTGKNFRDAKEVALENYTKTTNQGFAGSGRAN